ncbi:MAG TPA: hypothetical protein VH021_11270 [Trebonia sp.]|nr:hypothetical protein [Trebonia sp.]
MRVSGGAGSRASATLRTTGPDRAPYVVTSGIGVAEIAYVSTCLALFTMATMAALPVALARERRRSA